MAKKITQKSSFVEDYDRLDQIRIELQVFCMKHEGTDLLASSVADIWAYLVEHYNDVQKMR